MVIEEPRSARREATRQRILDAARVVFAEKGVFGASIEDICEQAGFTRGAVYSNFADKDDILRAVIEREHQALLDHIAGSIDIVDEDWRLPRAWRRQSRRSSTGSCARSRRSAR